MVKVETDKTFVNHCGTKVSGYYVDAYLKANLDYLKKMVRYKWDGVGILSGSVGAGKTTLSHMICHYLDPTFNLDRIVFTGQELMKQIDKAKKGQAIVMDEAIMALSSQDFARDLQKSLIKKFTTIRSKNLYILLIIPNFFLMRKWFAIDRTKFMIYCYSPDGLKRGYFRFFSWTKKKKLYLKGYKTMDIKAQKANFIGRFTNTENYFIDADAYEEKKQEAVKAITDEGKSEIDELKEKHSLYIDELKQKIKDYKAKLNKKNKDKYTKIRDSYKERYSKLKSDYAEKFKQHKKDTKSIAKYEKLCKFYDKLLYWSYTREKELYERANIGKELSEKAYVTLLKERNIVENDYNTLKKNFKAGKELFDLGL